MFDRVCRIHIGEGDVQKGTWIGSSLTHAEAVHITSLARPILLLSFFLLDHSWTSKISIEVSCLQVLGRYVELDNSNQASQDD